MNNPFADMQREREQRKGQERQESDRKYEAKRIAAEQRKEIACEYDKVVRPLLEQLRDAVYSRHTVVGCYAHPPEHYYVEYKTSWGIGETYVRGGCGEDSGTEDWLERVRIELEFDADNRPSHFKCTRFATYKRQRPVQLPPPPKKSLFGRSNKQPASPQPVEYEDVRYEPLVVELSQEALVKALRQLHPAGSY